MGKLKLSKTKMENIKEPSLNELKPDLSPSLGGCFSVFLSLFQ